MNKRSSGVLLHITSLPSPYGIGDLGPAAYRFADLLSSAGQRYWQILPLNPTCPEFANSPYQSTSAFAGNTWIISPEQMVADGFLAPEDIADPPDFPVDRVDYRAVLDYKNGLFDTAFERFKERGSDFRYEDFAADNTSWLNDYAIFMALRERFSGRVWGDWPAGIRDRHEEALRKHGAELADRIFREKFLQYVFDRQWETLKNHCRMRHLQIIGDIPIYLTYDSVDLWANPGLFKLDEQKKPTAVAGVPPDMFSDAGQLWGNPVYNWDAHRERGFGWWESRIDRTLTLVDRLRLDHFRGFVQFWEVPAGEETARNGRWVDAPGRDLFTLLARSRPCLPIIAEDLGHITPDVHEMMAYFGFPGMKILTFGFAGDVAHNPHAPHNITEGSVAYTGTHDNNTVRGWFERETSEEQKNLLFRYIGGPVSGDEIHRILIRLAMLSPADTVIVPMQDVLGLGEEARMNRPGTTEGNWEWRLRPDQAGEEGMREFAEVTGIYGRG
ncbi:4-alpha-glucanotransferase [Methanoculleus horonobensis]|jgi:4-alpha-glucanotransferase|uniref:4-alpha-glucanotransferase n=1 Tax=Methanoculleus horonobensis TaxID=528314 RepID=UPI000830850C|nr:4-alpha-glucanotransferase [Methanoculleus horonobensis]MDD3070064.1 4-alpha-glucanotransferase [Methanoculleus horonobensis]MDD4251736.1 4-alpha-glucanotransferase [Methanoculleus horonobensis]